MSPEDEVPDQPSDPSADQPDQPPDKPPPEPREPVEHDDTGLDLARSVARSLTRPGSRAARRAGRVPGLRPGESRRRRGPQVSGSHPDERDPQLLDSTIGRLIDEQGWGTDVRVHAVFSRWQVLVGAEVAQHCVPEAFSEGRLVVRTDSTAWATQMRLLTATVLRRLNQELGDDTVRLIEVQGPQGPTWKRGLRSVRGGRGPRDTYG